MQLRGMPRAILRGSRLKVVELSPQAQTRLQALTVWQRTGQWTVASEVFGLSRATMYRWRQRYDPQDLSTLAARSRRPHRVRQPQTPRAVVERIRALRKQYPRWGREKLRVLFDAADRVVAWQDGFLQLVLQSIRQINRMKRPQPAAAPTTKECLFCLSAIPIKATRCPHCTSELKAG